MMAGMDTVEREALLDAPAPEVWEAITDPAHIGDWFGAEADGPLDAGEVVVFRSSDGTERRAYVEDVQPERRVTFRWLGTTDTSRVEITCEPVGDATLLRITERRIEAATTPTPTIGFRSHAMA